MPIKVTCTCGKSIKASDKYAGKTVKCPECKNPLAIPKPSAAGAKPAAAGAKSGGTVATSGAGGSKIPVKCSCGKSFQAKPELMGKTVKCPGCSKPLKIGAKAKARSVVKRPPKDGAENENNDLFAEAGLADMSGGGHKCPECKSSMKADAIICIECGFNENLGRKMDVVRPVTAEERAARAADRGGGSVPKSMLKKQGGRSRTQSKNVLLLPFLRYAEFNGRSRRAEYWLFGLVCMGLQFAAIAVGMVMLPAEQALLPVVAIALLLLIPSLAVTVRRLHDTNRNALWLLTGLIPILGGLALLFFMVMPGTDGPNNFGPDPLD